MIRVLVVDDDFMVATVHCGFVERLPGFQVVAEAHDGAAALAAVEAHRPDLVLLDIYLPDMSGLEVLRRLRALRPAGAPGAPGAPGDAGVDVMAITAARDVDTIRDAMLGGVVQYLVKPFGLAALEERLEQYAEARRALARVAVPDQDDVDRVFRMMRGSSGTPPRVPLPKGLSPQTWELVSNVLREAAGDLSAAETAARSGLSRVSARRYLEHLVEARRARLQLRYGAAGRPEHRYVWAPDE